MDTTATKTKRNFWKDINSENVSAGSLAGIFAVIACSLLLVNAGAEAGLTQQQTISWVSSAWIFGGALGIFLGLYTRKPIVGGWSIPAAVMLSTTLGNFTFEQAVGGYFMGGVLVFLIGLSGLVNVIIRYLPLPIIMAMIAGALIKFGTGIVVGISDLPIIAGIPVLTYFFCLRWQKIISPIIPALLIGLVLFYTVGDGGSMSTSYEFQLLELYVPAFSIDAFFAISIPLAILVIGAENAQATGILMTEGYKPPVKTMTVLSGVGGMVACWFGSHNANIGGPATAICAGEGAGEEKEKRYVASILCGVICLVFGIFASYALAFVKVIPVELVAVIAGLAMINTLIQAFQMSFGGEKPKLQLGAFASFCIALSGISIFNITAPFWALVFGVLISMTIDKKDYFAMVSPKVQDTESKESLAETH